MFHWRFNIPLTLALILCKITEASQCLANKTLISGGDYEPNIYRNSFVMKEVYSIGPKLCIKECLYHKGCDAVNYKTDFICELLSTNPGDVKLELDYSFYSEIADWKMEQNQCLPNPCDEFEECVVASYDYYVCFPVENRCRTNPCLNGGICRNTVNGTRCECRSGCSGVICEHTLCDSNPCFNNGICHMTGAYTSYACTCNAGFTGDRCEAVVTESPFSAVSQADSTTV